MKLKFTLSLITILGFTLILNLNNDFLHSNSSGAPAMHTGSPGDNMDCSHCHTTSGTPVAGAILITSDVPSGGYISGNTYQITVRAAHATFNKFGFQISPQTPSGALVGTLATTNNTETQLVGSGKYVTHKAAGTAGTSIPMVGNYKEWSFNWTAPSPGAGNVTFYAAALLANGNNLNSGDSLVKGTLVINESATNSIQAVGADASNYIFPNPVVNNLNLFLAENAQVSIFNMNGSMLFDMQLNKGFNQILVDEFPKGLYFIKIENRANKELIKFVKF